MMFKWRKTKSYKTIERTSVIQCKCINVTGSMWSISIFLYWKQMSKTIFTIFWTPLSSVRASIVRRINGLSPALKKLFWGGTLRTKRTKCLCINKFLKPWHFWAIRYINYNVIKNHNNVRPRTMQLRFIGYTTYP